MKAIGLTAFALVLTAASGAQAQTVLARHIKSEPVETVVTRQANGTVTTTSRIMANKDASMRSPQRMVSTASLKPQTKIVYRTIVQREIVQAPQPQAVVVREPVTTWVPSILPPFSYPVTSYRDRVVYTTPAPTYTTQTLASPTVTTVSYQTPAYRVVEDDDETPVVRSYSTPVSYTTPVSYVVRY